MAHLIHFDELTWPEVAALPRDLPLVLPLGSGFDEMKILAALGAEEAGLLPPLPYVWAGSAVEVETTLLLRVIERVFSGPRDDGFSRFFVIHDFDTLAVEGARSIRLERRTSDRPVIAATPQRVILMPCGHTEQHGYHLPLNTDTIIIDAIARGVVQALPDEAEMLPTLPYGVSMYRDSFAGTFNLGGRIYEDFLLAVIDSLVRRGADRFYLLSGHGGNGSFLHNVVKYAGDRHRPIFVATAFLHTSGHLGAPALERYRRSARGGMGHAGELETSYMLHLRPELCRMERVVDETEFIATPNYYMDWIEGGALIMNAPWEDDTLTGSYGAGSLATAENGAHWLAAAVQEKIDHVREIHEQARRRIAKRERLIAQGVLSNELVLKQRLEHKRGLL